MSNDNKKLSRRTIEEIWNNQQLDVVDELIAADIVHHDPQLPSPVKGVEGYKQFVRYYLNAFPDLHFTIDDQLSDEHTVVSRWTATGTHKGDLSGIPATGRRISVTGITYGQIADGKFVETWSSWDALGLMQQLGAVGSEAAGRAA